MKKCLFLMLMMVSMSVMGQNDYFVTTREQDEQVNEVEPQITEEKQFIMDNFKYINVTDWKRGMRFMVVDDDSLGAFLRDKSLNGRLITDFYHQIVTVDTVEVYVKDQSKNWAETYVAFNTMDGDVLEFKCSGVRGKFQKDKLNAYIRGLIYLDEIDVAKRLLVGKTLYTLTNKALVDTPDGERFKKVPKFSPFKVIEVGVGDMYHGPLKMICTGQDGKKVAFYVILSGTNNDFGDGIGNGFFYNAFSFTNPRTKYKNIGIADWNLIKEGKVRIGMNQNACRLSWGEPRKINRTTGSYGVHEQWVYYNSYLYFENGKLTAIQN